MAATAPAAPGGGGGGVTKEQMAEFYSRVYPVESLVQWLSYGKGAGYLARREFCFTLIGDIFTRFRSYATTTALRAELTRSAPEKIDIGAVYDIAPAMKATTAIRPMERELVFDIDMSDYDAIRSCCKGKSVCPCCWTWMAIAAKIIRQVMTENFGFSIMLPVFSGRRGLHVWICDERARMLPDDERAAIVGYMSCVLDHNRVNVYPRWKAAGLHPTIRRIDTLVLRKYFDQLFVSPVVYVTDDDGTTREISNDNCIFTNEKAATVVYRALCNAEKDTPVVAPPPQRKKRIAELNRYAEGAPFAPADWDALVHYVDEIVLIGMRFSLMYPRLDEKVSASRGHLLKLPFCVHPSTKKLCVPLTWDAIDGFDPNAHPPRLEALLETGTIEAKWMAPLRRMLAELEEERESLGLVRTPFSKGKAAAAVIKQEDASMATPGVGAEMAARTSTKLKFEQ